MSGVKQQEAAVGAMHRPRLDQLKVRNEKAALGGIFDGSDQVSERRMKLADNWNRAVFVILADKHVDIITVHRVPEGRAEYRAQLVARLFDEQGNIIDEIGANRVQML